MASTAVAPLSNIGKPRLTVIVPAHNNASQLEQSLKALRESTFVKFEIIVADDCSSDDLRPLVSTYAARYVRTPRNMGPAGARNLAAEKAQGDILVLVDADVCVAPDALARIAAHFDSDRDLAGVFGSYDDKPACNGFVSQMKNLIHHYVHQNSSQEAKSFWAGCGALRKSVFMQFGGFDADAFPRPSIEDIELGLRITRAGNRILLDKEIQGKHLKRWTISNLLHADIFCRAVPWSKLILQTRDLPRDLNLTYAARLSSICVALLCVSLLALPITAIAHSWPGAKAVGAAVAVLVSGLLILNARMYTWFVRRRGIVFTAGVILFHWFYYFYSGVTFAACAVAHRSIGAEQRRPTTTPAIHS